MTQALQVSGRGLRLHTFEREERAYTSTPTKIGGHCLDHVRNGLTLRLRSGRSTASLPTESDIIGDRSATSTVASTFEPRGRFGGLCSVVLQLAQPLPSHRGSIHMSGLGEGYRQGIGAAYDEPFLSPHLLDITPGVLANCGEPETDWTSYRSQVNEHRKAVAASCYGVADARNLTAQRGSGSARQRLGDAVYRHGGALTAVMLSKLANSRLTPVTTADGSSGERDGAVDDAHGDVSRIVQVTRLTRSTNRAQPSSFKEAEDRVDDATTGGEDVADVQFHDVGGSRASEELAERSVWKARIMQTPEHSKLRTYSLVRKLGTGSHGAAFLVRKREGGGEQGTLRVLKESRFLPEASNEARLLRMVARKGIEGRVMHLDRGREGSAHCPTWELNRANPRHGRMQPRTHSDCSCDRRDEKGAVVQLYDYFVEELDRRPTAFLELEYCEGGDLHERITCARVQANKTASELSQTLGLSTAEIARVALGLSDGLRHLHERGVVHRDLKPANILLTKGGSVKIADLGVSTHLRSSRPLTENAAGTIPFMAPEVRKFLLGSKVTYNATADIWALGAVIYAMSVGDPSPEELPALSRAELVSVVRHRTRSEGLSLVVHRALNPDPSKRPSANEVKQLLEDCCRSEQLPPCPCSDHAHHTSPRRWPSAPAWKARL